MSSMPNFCNNCGEKLNSNISIEECPKCHSALHEHSSHVQDIPSAVQPLPYKSPGTAALIALIGGIFSLPGIGHIYIGKVGKGIAILVVGFVLYIITILWLLFSIKPYSDDIIIPIIILLFSHVYTWSILMMVTAIFLAAMLKLSYYSKKSIILLLLVVLSSVVIDVARMTITGSASGIEQDISIAKAGIGLEQFALRWSNLIDTTQHNLGSQFSNFIILILGAYWLYRSNLREPSTILLVIFLSLGIIPLFFGDWIVQSRILYNIPFQIPAAIAFTYIKSQANRNIILLPISIWLVAMSVRAVSNFYLTLPS